MASWSVMGLAPEFFERALCVKGCGPQTIESRDYAASRLIPAALGAPIALQTKFSVEGSLEIALPLTDEPALITIQR
jgi:hypothetical protein